MSSLAFVQNVFKLFGLDDIHERNSYIKRYKEFKTAVQQKFFEKNSQEIEYDIDDFKKKFQEYFDNADFYNPLSFETCGDDAKPSFRIQEDIISDIKNSNDLESDNTFVYITPVDLDHAKKEEDSDDGYYTDDDYEIFGDYEKDSNIEKKLDHSDENFEIIDYEEDSSIEKKLEEINENKSSCMDSSLRECDDLALEIIPEIADEDKDSKLISNSESKNIPSIFSNIRSAFLNAFHSWVGKYLFKKEVGKTKNSRYTISKIIGPDAKLEKLHPDKNLFLYEGSFSSTNEVSSKKLNGAFKQIDMDLVRLTKYPEEENSEANLRFSIPFLRNILFLYEFNNITSKDFNYIQGISDFGLAIITAFIESKYYYIGDSIGSRFCILEEIEAFSFLLYSYSMEKLNACFDSSVFFMHYQEAAKTSDMAGELAKYYEENGVEEPLPIEHVINTFYSAWLTTLFSQSLFALNRDLWYQLFNEYFLTDYKNLSRNLITFSSKLLSYFKADFIELAKKDHDNFKSFKDFANVGLFMKLDENTLRDVINYSRDQDESY